MNYRFLVFLLLAIPHLISGQDTTRSKILAGPYSGSVTKTSAKVWIAYRGSGAFSISLTDSATKNNVQPTVLHKIADSKGDTVLSLDFGQLEPGHTYGVTTMGLRRTLQTPECFFSTISEAPVKDMDFLVGSCAYLSLGFMKMVLPGAAVRIFHSMTRGKSDLMIWLGDNIYYMGKEHSSYARMFECNLKTRMKYNLLDKFLASTPQYSIWDDHDYGPNDSDRRFPLKDTSLIIFRNFWINPYEDSIKQTFFTYRYYDAEFFMTDDRWWRDPKGDPAGSFLGPYQSAWLKNKLLTSTATFKFICVGSQVMNEGNPGECYAQYPKERNELLDYIVAHNIKGVIFLTGDTHYGEMTMQNWKGYPIYDFTTSPLTSPMDPSNLTVKNKFRVKDTELFHRNYGRIKITGPEGNRVCNLSLYNMDGKLKWEHSIKADEIQKK